MSLSKDTRRMLSELVAVGVEFVVVGGCAAIMGGAFIVTEDLAHKTPKNL